MDWCLRGMNKKYTIIIGKKMPLNMSFAKWGHFWRALLCLVINDYIGIYVGISMSVSSNISKNISVVITSSLRYPIAGHLGMQYLE